MLLTNQVKPQIVKHQWGPAKQACPLLISLHFHDRQLEKITLSPSKEFTLQSEGMALDEEMIDWFASYLEKREAPFPFPLFQKSDSFVDRVWSYLLSIPMGETRTYGEVASELGHPKAARAVGMACGKNPFPLIVPCHRVIRSSGQLGGFAFGNEIKQTLLTFEGSL